MHDREGYQPSIDNVVAVLDKENWFVHEMSRENKVWYGLWLY